MARVLIIDDDPNLGEVLTFTLADQGHEVESYRSAETGLAAAEAFRPEVLITDLKMPGGIGGMEVLKRSLAADPARPVILLTAYGTIEDAVEAMKLGAFDYLTKPYNREELRLRVEAALERHRLLVENRSLRSRLRAQTGKLEIVHVSEAMARVVQTIERIAPTEATVLITGESGTGKELVARALHSRSERCDGPFVAINCAAIPRELLESELFGHRKGAFTGAVMERAGKFQQAEGGTLFLDEIGELAPEMQTKLLRVLETREVDVLGGTRPLPVNARIIAATNADLPARVGDGRFRSDLFYRLCVIPIHVPALRERPEDIPALWQHFVRIHAGETTVRSSPELLRALIARPWPGNVRELANFCQRMVLLRGSDILSERDLGVAAGAPTALGGMTAASPSPPGQAGSVPDRFLGEFPPDGLSLLDVEREIIRHALAMHGGNRTRAAAYLDIPRHVLLYRLEKFGLQ